MPSSVTSTEQDLASKPYSRISPAMSIDASSQASKSTRLTQLEPDVTIDKLRKAIPPHCFKSSYATSLRYLAQDVVMTAGLMYGAYKYIPGIEHYWLRFAAWALYGYIQGLVFTGMWVLAHECGHGSFTPSEKLNHVIGFLLHTFVMAPYYSWRSTHRRHHLYANNLSRDHNYVPARRDEFATSKGIDVEHLEEMTEDAPLVTFIRLMVQQTIGFPWYMFANITAGEGSLPKPRSNKLLGNSHLAPWGSLFRKEEAHLILITDIGLAAMAFVLYMAHCRLGSSMTMLLYLQPYVWVNHWIVAITFMHHTHPDLPKFEDKAWTFLKGATSTVDRQFGWVGRKLMHNIVDFHVVHHLFPKIPFYHTEEATRAIQPLMGGAYREDKQRGFLSGLWESFTKCQWVEPEDSSVEAKDQVMWYRGYASPAPEAVAAMGIRGVMRQARSLSTGLYAKWQKGE